MDANKKPVAELEGAELDYWVAVAQGWHMGKAAGGACYAWCDENNELKGTVPASAYQPSTNWGQAGPIIESEEIGFLYVDGSWVSDVTGTLDMSYSGVIPASFCSGPTPIIAAMRTFVASKFGEYVEAEGV